ncbi:MAG: cystathionine beta-synthase [Bacteroidota bacterium]
MEDKRLLAYIKAVLDNMPADWLRLTTHRLDIYNEKLAKTEFLEAFEALFTNNNAAPKALSELPTAYDYVRLGHPLSCVLEWAIAKRNHLKANNVISFSSKTIPLLAVLRKNLLDGKASRILYSGSLPDVFDKDKIEQVYGYQFDLIEYQAAEASEAFEGSTILLSQSDQIFDMVLQPNIDFLVSTHAKLGGVLFVNGEENESYIPDIQHVRRRETIAMTPANALHALQALVGIKDNAKEPSIEPIQEQLIASIQDINATKTPAVVGSSGLSIQYAIMMGLIDDALERHPDKEIKFIVPTNCYGGTNDQARRVAACIPQVEIVDWLVDGDNDMNQSLARLLAQIARANAIPYIIAEIPTNPRVEVPDLQELQAVLTKDRQTQNGEAAIEPVFILDQTFCPNVHFLGKGEILSPIRAISYASGSKFPSGGLVTAGYCIGNQKAEALMAKVALHLKICDNEATDFQYQILAEQLPSMIQRIKDAYTNTREFVNFIQAKLPTAKINFVSEALAKKGFTPSVFSLDLPTKGEKEEEKEAYKRALNLKLIKLMIGKIPEESKYCVSYGQLKGCYWTIPATSTQGTTKEGDKDYIIRASLSPKLDLARHKEVFAEFVDQI